MDESIDATISRVGPALRELRRRRRLTLAQLSSTSGISPSTLSRLEAGRRRPTLELLLALARAHGIGLEELLSPARRRPALDSERPFRLDRATLVPLSRETRGIRAFKTILDGGAPGDRLESRVHDGFVWLYVLRGRLRLVLDAHELELEPGEVAEFTTRVPHRLSAAGDAPVELLTIFAEHGEPPRVRARTSRRSADR